MIQKSISIVQTPFSCQERPLKISEVATNEIRQDLPYFGMIEFAEADSLSQKDEKPATINKDLSKLLSPFDMPSFKPQVRTETTKNKEINSEEIKLFEGFDTKSFTGHEDNIAPVMMADSYTEKGEENFCDCGTAKVTLSEFDQTFSCPDSSIFDCEEDSASKLNIATLENRIVSYIEEFDFNLAKPEEFIDCLQAYKNTVTNYMKNFYEYEKLWENFKRYYRGCRVKYFQQMDGKRKSISQRYNKLDWQSVEEYFIDIDSNLVNSFKSISGSSFNQNVLVSLNLFAVNRMSALLKALKYCRDANLNFDEFQKLIEFDKGKYLRSVTMKTKINNAWSRYYPSQEEFGYLLSLSRDGIITEIEKLRKMIIQGNKRSESQSEKTIKEAIKSLSQKNSELIKKIGKRVVRKCSNSKKRRPICLLENYNKYTSNLKKRKEDSFIRCTTGYTEKEKTSGKFPSISIN